MSRVSVKVLMENSKVKQDLACVCGSFGLVVDVRMSFGRVICMVGGSRSQVPSSSSNGTPQAHVMDFIFFIMMVLFATPNAVVLSV